MISLNNPLSGLTGVDQKIIKTLSKIMKLGIEGYGVFSSAEAIGRRYLDDPELKTKEDKVDALIKNELHKNFASGFLTSFGGIITLPATIPASLVANWIIQTRMSAAIAHVVGFNLAETNVRLAVSVCLLGKSGKSILNSDIRSIQSTLRSNTISKSTRNSLLLLNQAVATRLMRLSAARGFSRFSKAVPIVGGIIGGTLDYRSCLETAEFAKEMFLNSPTQNQDET